MKVKTMPSRRSWARWWSAAKTIPRMLKMAKKFGREILPPGA